MLQLLLILIASVGTFILPGSPPLDVTQYQLPIHDAGPLQLASDREGNVWVVESTANKIAEITPRGDIREISIPTPNSLPRSIAIGNGGKVWFSEWGVGKLAFIQNYHVTEVALPSGTHPFALAIGAADVVWFTDVEGGSDRKIVLKPEQPSWIGELGWGGVRRLKLRHGDARAIAYADGWIWLAQVGYISRMNTSGSQYSYPIGLDRGPNSLVVDREKSVWFTDPTSNSIGKLLPSGSYKQYKLPTADAVPFSLCVATNSDLWFTESGVDRLGRIAQDGEVSEYDLKRSSYPAGISAGKDGSIWFALFNHGAILRAMIAPE